MNETLILSIDQGTSSTKTLIFDEKGVVLQKATEPLKTNYLEGNRVEQIPEDIYQNVLTSVQNCLQGFVAAGGDSAKIKTAGISNQRETFILWDKEGKPLYNAVVWQCKRSIDICNRLQNTEIETILKEKTGLIIDPYFSGTKVIWLNENEPKVREAIASGEAYFGNVDTWILYKLTGGKSYLTDYTNASRTMFFNLKTLTWDHELLDRFGLTGLNLPEVKPSSAHFGETNFEGIVDHNISISSMIGDSHAAAFGESCFAPGDAKATLGTGSSILMNIGNQPINSQHGMVTTICWSAGDRVDYALEGIIVSAGSTVEWVKNQLGLFEDVVEIEKLISDTPDNGGVYIVPAFSGLGAPHWDMDRKGSIVGLTFDSRKNHVVRAAVESIPYQIKDVISAMEQDSGTPLVDIKIDGGITKNDFVVQFLADLLDRKVTNIAIADVSALGAGYLAGLQVGIFKDLEHLSSLHPSTRSTVAGSGQVVAQKCYTEWQDAIRREY